jgi:hypothetical protein
MTSGDDSATEPETEEEATDDEMEGTWELEPDQEAQHLIWVPARKMTSKDDSTMESETMVTSKDDSAAESETEDTTDDEMQ